MASSSSDDRHPRDRLERQLGLGDATLLCVASVIGSGIFLSPDEIAGHLPQPGWILAAWLVGGALSLAGALANAELGAMFPHAGGDYVYLREAFGARAGFLAGWISFFAIFAGTIATLSIGFAELLRPFVALGAGGEVALAIGLVIAASALNYVGVRGSARVSDASALVKIGALALFALLAPFALGGDSARLDVTAPASGPLSPASFGLALSPVLFAYLGWNAAVFVASEIRAPQRNVPRALLLGLAICTALYLAVNAVYLYALPIDALRAAPNAGEAAASVLFGPGSGRVVGIFALLSILGTLNATILVGPRIAYAMALDDRFVPGVERVHPRFRTPHVAVVLQAGVAILLLGVLRGFPSVLDFTTFALVLATIADTLALFALRRARPNAERPYRAWGYPWVPALYVAANLAVALALALGRPKESLICAAVLLAGLPVFALVERRRSRS